jgi:GNAT superfamily N-acetyltransferase
LKEISIREKHTSDLDWIRELLIKGWSSLKIVTLGELYQADKVPGLVALIQDKPVGLLTYIIKKKAILIISFNSLIKNIGIGTAFINYLSNLGKREKLNSILVTTTNDNIEASLFYQKRGFQIIKINVGIIEEYRKLKPEIPKKGNYDIEIRDEIILKKELNHR